MPPADPSGAEPYRSESQRVRNPKQNSDLEKWPTRVVAIFTAAIFLSSGIYAYFAYRQWQVMLIQLDATERAWLVGAGIRSFKVNKDGLFVAKIAFTNVGKGPAFQVQQGFNSTWEPQAPTLPLLPGSELTMASGAKTETEVTFTDISKDEMDRVFKGYKPLFIWLRLKYADPFSDNRYTQECMVYNATLKAFVICGPGTHIHR